MDFQRARSEEQRILRRRAIVEEASRMLQEMRVADVSLNELSRRVGLAKSNVLRYVESREAVLLELLDGHLEEWIADLDRRLVLEVENDEGLETRARRTATVVSTTLSERPVLCDLLGAQGGVLERNVSAATLAQHGRSFAVRLDAVSQLLCRHLPELGEGARTFCAMILVSAGALSANDPPPPSFTAACSIDPDLEGFRIDLRDSLEFSATAFLLGVLPRS